MDYTQFVKNAVRSVQMQIGGQMVQLDKDLRSLNVFRVTEAREKIIDMAEQSVGNYLETLPKKNLKELADYVSTFEDVPLDILKSQDNFDYSSAMVKRIVCSYIIEKAELLTNNKLNENSAEPEK